MSRVDAVWCNEDGRWMLLDCGCRIELTYDGYWQRLEAIERDEHEDLDCPSCDAREFIKQFAIRKADGRVSPAEWLAAFRREIQPLIEGDANALWDRAIEELE